ncbi:transporter substrate-binding domain-containing protein [uncultured Roseobacter sp.]|uniref:substrate-binding periplasmic protein n=1 Tax=uncultured Roseobacter sp. TaxID=114847 RepID=UPI00261892ED|nr:transporter substrate-binding domain-containing protein [uncultured Roseobacter sp.]
MGIPEMIGLKRLLLSCAVLMSLATTPGMAQDSLLIVADEWPPFSGQNLPDKGLSLDITRTALTRAGYDVEVAVLPWARIMSGAQTGEYDVITSLFRDPEIQKVMTYSEPFFETTVRFVQRKGGPITFEGLNSLQAYRIAVAAGYVYEEAFDTADFLDKIEVTTPIQGLRMVAAGRVDLTLDSMEVVRHSIRLQDPDILDQIEFLDPALARQEIHMAVSGFRDDHNRIVSDFNAALQEMREDGSLARLLKKHQID